MLSKIGFEFLKVLRIITLKGSLSKMLCLMFLCKNKRISADIIILFFLLNSQILTGLALKIQYR